MNEPARQATACYTSPTRRAMLMETTPKSDTSGHEPTGATYWNPDLAPVLPAALTWGVRDLAALWVALAACVPTYMLGAALIDGGMSGTQAVLTIFLANLIVLVPIVLNAHPGTKYGIPFPVYCRAAFGVRGANVPAVLRAAVACGWFGIQCWIGGAAVYRAVEPFAPSWAGAETLPAVGLSGPQLGCFLGFWALNVAVLCGGIGAVRGLLPPGVNATGRANNGPANANVWYSPRSPHGSIPPGSEPRKAWPSSFPRWAAVRRVVSTHTVTARNPMSTNSSYRSPVSRPHSGYAPPARPGPGVARGRSAGLRGRCRRTRPLRPRRL